MTLKSYIFILSISVITSFNTGLLGQTLDWEKVNIPDPPIVSGQLNGFNMGGYSYGRINKQSGNVSVTSKCNQCQLNIFCTPKVSGAAFSSMETKQNVVDQTAKLRPGVLRFPGGTHSGWYHLYKYNNQGYYDASAPVIAKGYGMSLIESAHLNNPLEYCKLDSRLTTDQNYLDGFTNYIQNIQNTYDQPSNIQVTYVANLLTHFRFAANQVLCSTCGRSKTIIPMEDFNCEETFSYPFEGNEHIFNNDPNVYRFELYYKESQDAISRIISNLDLALDDVIYVEMGNEYYSTDGYPIEKYQMSVADYVRLVETYSERLKCFFDNKINLKIGIVTKPNTPWQMGLVNDLDSDLNENGETLNTDVDAVIYHHYYNQSYCLDKDDIESRFDCAKDAFRNHIEIDLSANLNILQEEFPDQKIWITEWNMLNGSNNKNNSYLNTILHASFVQEYALGLMSYNASHNNVVEMATHHRLGDHNVWSVIQTQDGDNSTANFRSGGYAMKYLSNLYEYECDSTYYIGNILTDGALEADTKETKTTVVYQRSNHPNKSDRILIYFTNKTNSDIEYSFPSNIRNYKIKDVSISYLKGNHLFTYGPRNTTAGKNRYKNNTKTSSNEELNSLGYGLLDDQFVSKTDSFLGISESHYLPRNSIGVLKINLDNFVNTSDLVADYNVKLVPNPVSHSVKLSIRSKKHEQITIQIVNSNGRQEVSLSKNMTIGKNVYDIDTSRLGNGVYTVLINDGKAIASKKLVVIK